MARIIENILQYDNVIFDKKKAMENEISYMLNRTQSMFHYENLPSTIPALELELILQTKGNAFITKHNDKLYAFNGNAGGELDEYSRAKFFIVTNTALNLSKSYEIGIEGILMKNDSLELGLLPLFSKYSILLVENRISMRQAIINARVLSIIAAPDDRTKASADLFLKKLVDGELAAIAETPFFEGIKSHNISAGTNRTISQLIESEQYLKASLFNEIGLDANYNMKRESISSNEAELNDDFLLPLVDDFINCRRQALKEINEMFDTDITVEFSSTWLTNQLENEKQKAIYSNNQIEGNSNYSDTLDVEKESIEEINSEIKNSNYSSSIDTSNMTKEDFIDAINGKIEELKNSNYLDEKEKENDK